MIQYQGNKRLITSETKLFLILIPAINIFNYYLTYHNIPFSSHTLLTFSLDTVEGYVAWIAVHKIIHYLDRQMPFEQSVISRVTVQLITTVIAGMAIIVMITIILHYTFHDGPVPREFFTFDIFIISVWFLVINGIYIALHFYRGWKEAETKRVEESKLKAGGFRVKSQKQELLLQYEEIAGFMVDGEYIFCHTMSGKKYLLDQSMDKLEQLLPVAWFFRLNRQFLLHRQIVTGFEKSENGKLNILIKSCVAMASPIKMSRTRASDFKQWFQGE
jgi:DNA-binding LytR/AlgR family response regulator